MKRCGWISHLPKHTVCDVLFKQGVIDIVAKHMTGEEMQKLSKLVQKVTNEEEDEFNRFGPDKIGRYLNLDWNTITYGPHTKLAKCYALEFVCIDGLETQFTEILLRIFFIEKIPFPFGVGEFRPPIFRRINFHRA